MLIKWFLGWSDLQYFSLLFFPTPSSLYSNWVWGMNMSIEWGLCGEVVLWHWVFSFHTQCLRLSVLVTLQLRYPCFLFSHSCFQTGLFASSLTIYEILGLWNALDIDQPKITFMPRFYLRYFSPNSVICLGCNKDLWSWRSKYKSYGALRVQSGGKGSSPGVV